MGSHKARKYQAWAVATVLSWDVRPEVLVEPLLLIPGTSLGRMALTPTVRFCRTHPKPKSLDQGFRPLYISANTHKSTTITAAVAIVFPFSSLF